MTRSHRLIISALLVSAPGILTLKMGCAQRHPLRLNLTEAWDREEVEIVVTQVAPHLYVLRGTYANMAFSTGPDGVLLVDDDMAPLSDKIKAVIAVLAEHDDAQSPRVILNTHWHGDHTGGNEIFAAHGAIVIAHENVRTRLSTTQEVLGQRIEPGPQGGWPIVTFDRSVTLHFNGETIRVVHHPHGHTDGDVVVHFTGSKVVHLGDLYFEGYFPNIDLNSGGSVKGYIAAVEAVLAETPDDATIVPGHGPISTKADLSRFGRMLREIAAHVQTQLDAGATRNAVIAAGVPEQWSHLHTPEVTTERFLSVMYDSLIDTP